MRVVCGPEALPASLRQLRAASRATADRRAGHQSPGARFGRPRAPARPRPSGLKAAGTANPGEIDRRAWASSDRTSGRAMRPGSASPDGLQPTSPWHHRSPALRPRGSPWHRRCRPRSAPRMPGAAARRVRPPETPLIHRLIRLPMAPASRAMRMRARISRGASIAKIRPRKAVRLRLLRPPLRWRSLASAMTKPVSRWRPSNTSSICSRLWRGSRPRLSRWSNGMPGAWPTAAGCRGGAGP
jgi:hypothetical protein